MVSAPNAKRALGFNGQAVEIIVHWNIPLDWSTIARMKHAFATILYDPDAPEGSEYVIEVNELGRGMLATLTDFELKVCATEISLHVRKQLEMPPSPSPLS